MTQNNILARRSARRVVTGHDSAGLSVIEEDRESPYVQGSPDGRGPFVIDLWKTHATPANNASGEPCTTAVSLAPPKNGSVARIVEFPPDASYMTAWDARETFGSLGHVLDDAPSSRGVPGMHKTQSLDYAIVLTGEIWAVMDKGETC